MTTARPGSSDRVTRTAGGHPAPPRRVGAVAWTAIALPLLVGAVVSGALLGSGDSRALRLEVPLATLAIAVGLLVTAGAALATLAVTRQRRRLAATAHDVAASARAAEHEAHRRFLSRLDHELKNPVTAVRAAAASLPSATSPDERDRLVAVVDQQTARLATLVADLRKLGDLETQPIELERVDVTELVTDAVADLQERLTAVGQAREVVLTLPTVPWPLPPVTGDVDLLHLALSNVLGNAVKFSPAGSPLEVRGRERDGVVEIEVADAGMGIPPAEVGTVFDELARGLEARGIPGSGIGLALVRTVVRRHGGDVSLRSRHGSGTVVRIDLPVAG